MTTLQKSLMTIIEHRASLLKQVDNLSYIIEMWSRNLLDDLRSIDGWEAMIEERREEYERYPDKFFSWCEVNTHGHTVTFVRRDDTVLTIDLEKPLKEQVIKAAVENGKEQDLLQLSDDSLKKIIKLVLEYRKTEQDTDGVVLNYLNVLTGYVKEHLNE
jgi:hypothetical protein